MRDMTGKRTSRLPVAPHTDAPAEPASWMPSIDADTSVKYTSIVNSMTQAIAAGELAEGERLPPHRELAARLGVTVATVTKAIAELARRGLVDTRRGSGTFVLAPPAVARAAAAVEPPGLPLDLAVNRPLATLAAPFMRDALAAVAARADSAELFGYEVVGGNAENRAMGRAWLSERGISVGESEVLLTQGGNDGLLAAFLATCRPGEAVACEATNYTGIRRLAQALGLTLVPVETDRLGMRPDALERACRPGNVRAVLCTPVTHNPTAATMDAARRAAIARVVERADLMLIEDDIYGHLAGDDAEPFYCHMPDRTIHVTSMSKCLTAGLRAGYLAVPPMLAGKVRDALYTMSWTAPSLHAGIASRLIGSGAARDLVVAQRAEAMARIEMARDILGEVLDGDALRAHEARPTYHLWLTLKGSLRAEEASAELQRAGILVSPAHNFVVGGAAVPNAIRLSLGALPDRAVLTQALHEVMRHLAGHQLAVGAIA